MINRITMETVAYLRSKCRLKQNLIPSWPWSFRHTSCISDYQCKAKIVVGHPDCHTWQYCRSLLFYARSVRRSDEFQKVWVYSLFNSIFSSPESKAQLTFSDRKVSVVCLSTFMNYCIVQLLVIYFRYSNIKTEVHTSVFCYFG